MLRSGLFCLVLLTALPALAESAGDPSPVRGLYLTQIEGVSGYVTADERAKPKTRHTIFVFTDVDCPYCRKLHGELDVLQARGIAVRYLAFPRSGPGTKAWKTMTAVWCAKDRREALTRATKGEEVIAALEL